MDPFKNADTPHAQNAESHLRATVKDILEHPYRSVGYSAIGLKEAKAAKLRIIIRLGESEPGEDFDVTMDLIDRTEKLIVSLEQELAVAKAYYAEAFNKARATGASLPLISEVASEISYEFTAEITADVAKAVEGDNIDKDPDGLTIYQ